MFGQYSTASTRGILILFELPNNWYALRYDSCTCVTLLTEIGHFCPILDVSHPIIDVFQMLTFWTFAREQFRMLRGESRYSSNDRCGVQYYTGRGVVISSVQKITRPTIPGVQ